MKKLLVLGICIVLAGCNSRKDPDESGPIGAEPISVEASEDKETTFIAAGKSFELSKAQLLQIKQMVRKAKAAGKNNVSFMFVSNTPISEDKKEKAENKIRSAMYECGFADSRIVNAGTVVYDEAKNGVRIDLLQYSVKDIDMSPWDTEIGDADMYKSTPKYGAASAYNLNEMIVDKADFVNPRKYKGQRVTDAIESTEVKAETGSSSSSSSSSSTSSSSSSSSSLSSGN